MDDGLPPLTGPTPGPGPSRVRFAARAVWVAIQLAAVYYFGKQGALFFYQNF